MTEPVNSLTLDETSYEEQRHGHASDADECLDSSSQDVKHETAHNRYHK
jgi:hypothetical protein